MGPCIFPGLLTLMSRAGRVPSPQHSCSSSQFIQNSIFGCSLIFFPLKFDKGYFTHWFVCLFLIKLILIPLSPGTFAQCGTNLHIWNKCFSAKHLAQKQPTHSIGRKVSKYRQLIFVWVMVDFHFNSNTLMSYNSLFSFLSPSKWS